MFAGNIQAKDRRAVMLKLQNIKFQRFVQVRRKMVGLLAHLKKLAVRDNNEWYELSKKSRKHEQVSLLLYLLSVKSSL